MNITLDASLFDKAPLGLVFFFYYIYFLFKFLYYARINVFLGGRTEGGNVSMGMKAKLVTEIYSLSCSPYQWYRDITSFLQTKILIQCSVQLSKVVSVVYNLEDHKGELHVSCTASKPFPLLESNP